MKTRPKVGLSILPEGDLRVAQLPLFADGLVEAIEWTLDAEFEGGVPDWVDALLDHYAAAGALYAHGVQFSPLSGVFEARQSRWLERARGALGKRPYRHVSEHFGFTTVPGLARGTPLPVPFVAGAVAIGRDRLRLLQGAASGAPVGLENLALAMSRDDVLVHGEFLDQLLEPTDGFLLLDLHNLYCPRKRSRCSSGLRLPSGLSTGSRKAIRARSRRRCCWCAGGRRLSEAESRRVPRRARRG